MDELVKRAKARERNRRWYARRGKEVQRRYYEANKEEIRAKNKAWYEANRDAARAQQAEYRRTHPSEIREMDRRYREANRARHNELNRASRKRHPESRASNESARRARKAGNGGSHTAKEWLEKCALLGNVCFYCGEAKPLTRDHKVPIARGGTDNIANIVPACLSCNCRKGTQTTTEFLRAPNPRVNLSIRS